MSVEYVRTKPYYQGLNSMDYILLFLLKIYFTIIPFYLWSSGLPQISDILIIIILVIYLIKNKGKFISTKQTNSLSFLILLFLLWTTIINLIWIGITGSLDFTVPIMFFTYNIMLVFFFISIIKEYGNILMKIIYQNLVLSVVIQVVFIYLIQGFTLTRATGTFNNPNQLGYYAILVSAILIFVSEKTIVKNTWFYIGILGAFFLVVASLSNSSILSWGIMMIIYLISKTENKKIKRNLLFLLLLGVVCFTYVYLNTNFFQTNEWFNGLLFRLQATNEKIEDISTIRGYYRITNYPQYWLFGAGEGFYTRFNQMYEFHSTLGNIQVSYGIIGTIIFSGILYISVKNQNFKYWYLIMTILLYGVTHNGIRSSILWIFLSLLATFKP